MVCSLAVSVSAESCPEITLYDNTILIETPTTSDESDIQPLTADFFAQFFDFYLHTA